MRKRITHKPTTKAALRMGCGLGVSGICLLTTLSMAHAQTISAEQDSGAETYGLRGTTTAETSETRAQARAAATLYGALPAIPTASDSSDLADVEDEPNATIAAQEAVRARESSEITTGSIGLDSDISQADQDFADSLARQNARVESIDGLEANPATDPDSVPGFTLGTLTLRPTLNQRAVHESIRNVFSTTSRVYSETTVSGTLDSNWSRHQLSINGSGTWQENLSGTGTESPSANIDAALRLDMINDITATLGAGYSYSQESRTDPNAISGADTQSGIHETRASIGLQKSLGILRGTTTLELTRTLYGDATLANGGTVLVDDRDTLGGEITTRVGYAVSPALVPFLEASVGRENYDQKIDSTGSERSSTSYGIRAGAEIDFGEKLNGEIAAGYLRRRLDDASLNDISGLTLDGELNWSPLRGTTINVGLATTVESSTSAGEAGAIVYELDSTLTHEIHSAVVARLGATLEYQDFDAGSNRGNQHSYGASTGLTWSINRYLDLDADASYERTTESGGTDERTTRLSLGLTLRR